MTIQHQKVNGSGNSRNGYQAVRDDLRDRVKELITVDEWRRALRAGVYRQARRREVTSSDGVLYQVATLRPRALQEPSP